MNTPIVTLALRFVHIVSGAMWVGIAVFSALLLTPAIQDGGPEGGKVAQALQRRGLATLMPILALGTLLSGVVLYWRASAGFNLGWIAAPVGVALGFGGLASIAAYGVGIAVVRPAVARVNELTRALQDADGDTGRAGHAEEIRRLRGRVTAGGRVIALLLLTAIGAMAVARYL